MNCVNINLPEFKALVSESGLPTIIVELKVAKYQSENGVESFPSLSDIAPNVEILDEQQSETNDILDQSSIQEELEFDNIPKKELYELEKAEIDRLEDITSKLNEKHGLVVNGKKIALANIDRKYNNPDIAEFHFGKKLISKDSTVRFKQYQWTHDESQAPLRNYGEYVTKESATARAKEIALEKYLAQSKQNIINGDSDISNANFDAIALNNATKSQSKKSKYKSKKKGIDGFVAGLFDQMRRIMPSTNVETRESLAAICKELSRRSGIKFEIISREAASKYYASKGKQYKNQPGFFSTETNTAYIVEGLADKTTAIHEILGHPFIEHIRLSNNTLYNSLLTEALSNESVLNRLKTGYSGYSGLAYEAEAIMAALDIYNSQKLDKSSSLYEKIKVYVKEFTAFIKSIFGSNSKLDYLTMDSSLEDISNWMMYGVGTYKIAGFNSNIKEKIDNIGITEGLNGKNVSEFADKHNLTQEERDALVDEFNDRYPILEMASVSEDSYRGAINTSEDAVKRIKAGLETRLNILRKKVGISKVHEDELKGIIRDMTMLGADEAVLKFMKYAESELISALPFIVSSKQLKRDGLDLDIKRMQSMHSEFVQLFSNAISIIKTLERKDQFMHLPDDVQSIFSDQLKAIVHMLDDMESDYKILLEYQFSKSLHGLGIEVGSTTIKDILDNPFEAKQDISSIFLFLGSAKYARKSEAIRALNYLINKTKNESYQELVTSEYTSKLIKIGKKLKNAFGYANFEKLYEKDDNGNKTGFLVAPLKYGMHFNNKMKMYESLVKKYGLVSKFDVPVDPEDLVKYKKDINKWEEDNSERIYINDYYRLQLELSADAKEMIDDANDRIYRIRNKYSDGSTIRTENMTPSDKVLLRDAYKFKKNLSSKYTISGQLKTDSDILIASEIKEFNDKVNALRGFTSNKKAFNERLAEITSMYEAGKMTESEFNIWKRDNTRVEISQKFYDKLKNLEEVDQTKEWKDLKERRDAIVDFYKNSDTQNVNVERMEHTMSGGRSVKSIVDEIDIILRKTRKKGSSKIFDIAEFVTTDTYGQKVAAAEEMAKQPWYTAEMRAEHMQWIKDNHHTDKKGNRVPNSYYMKMVPIDKSYISIQPNSFWSEISSDSKILNKNYDVNLSDDGVVPKKSIYDNKKEYSDVMSNPNLKDMHELSLDMLANSNKTYSYITRPGKYRLPQQEGSTLRSIMSSDNRLKTIKRLFKDFFSVKDQDEVFGEMSTIEHKIDRSTVKYVPTRHRAMLDDPSSISLNLPELLYSYYRGSIEYKHKSRIMPTVDLIREGLANTEIIPDASIIGKLSRAVVKKKGEANILRMADRLINEGIYDINKDLVAFSAGKSSFTLSKLGGSILKAFRASNLYLNKLSIEANIYSSWMNLNSEAATGMLMNRKNLATARFDFFSKLIATGFYSMTSNPNKSHILNTMRLFGVSVAADTQVKNIKGRNYLEGVFNMFGYGPYELGDFLTKGTMLSAMLRANKLYNGKFVSRAEFIALTKGEYKDRKTALKVFDSIPESLSTELKFDKDGLLSVPDKYKDAITSDLIARISMEIDGAASRIDGTLSKGEKTALHRSELGNLIMMHRNYVLSMIGDRFHGEMYSYENRRLSRGVYNTKIKDSLRMMGLWLRGSLNNMIDETPLDQANRYNFNRVKSELTVIVLSSALTSFLRNFAEGDDDDDSWLKRNAYELYVYMLRNVMELSSPYSPTDLWGQFKSPTTAQTKLESLKNITTEAIEGRSFEYVEGGKYDGQYRIYRNISKLVPYWTHLKEDFISPDLKSKERYLKTNIGFQYRIIDGIMYPKQDSEYEDESIDEHSGPTIFEQFEEDLDQILPMETQDDENTEEK